MGLLSYFFVILTLSLSLGGLMTGCSGSGSSDSSGSKSSPTLILGDLGQINLANEGSYAFQGECVGEDTLVEYEFSGTAAGGSNDPLEKAGEITCEDGAWSFNGVDLSGFADGEITLEVTLGEFTLPSITVTKDTQAPIFALNDLSAVSGETLEELFLPLSGTCEEDGTITIEVASVAAPSLEIPDRQVSCIEGTWDIQLDFSDLGVGDYTLGITITDTSENPGQSPLSITVNVTRNTANLPVALDPLPVPINLGNQASYSIGGTCQGSGTITIEVDSTALSPSSVCGASTTGRWEADLSGVEAVTGSSGSSVSIVVSYRDDDDNVIRLDPVAVTKDVTLPTFAVTPIGDFIGNGQLAVAGTCSEEGTISIQLALSSAPATALASEQISCAEDEWNGSVDFSSLSDDSYVIAVSFTDAADNGAAQAQQLTVTRDTVAPVVTLDALSGPINLDNQVSYSVSGDCEDGLAITVQINSNDLAGTAPICGATTSGRWEAALGIALGGVPDGTVTIAVSQRDGANNITAQEESTTKDATRPTFGIVTPPASGSYLLSQGVSFTVNFSEPVTVQDGTGGAPRLELTVGTGTKYADYASGSGTASLIFTYEVGSSDTDSDGIVLANDKKIDLNGQGGAVLDLAGNSLDADNQVLSLADSALTGVLISGVNIAIQSLSATNGLATQKALAAVTLTATFSAAVTVTGQPQLILSVGGTEATATYSSSASTQASTTHDFLYTVAAGDNAAVGEVLLQSIQLPTNSVTIVGSSTVTLTGYSLAVDHLAVDTTAPVLAITDPLPPGTSELWSWSCQEDASPPCEYRHVFNANASHEFLPAHVFDTATSGTPPGTLASGNYYLHVQAKDAIGNESAVTHHVLALNRVEVEITVAPPISGSTTQSQYTIEGTCSEEGQQVQVKLFAEGESEASVTVNPVCGGGGTAGEWSTVVATDTLAQGTLTITVSHSDASENFSNTDVEEVLKDTQPPVLAITSSAAISSSNARNYPVSGTCDEEGPVTVVMGGTEFSNVVDCSGQNWSGTVDTLDIPQGDVVITAYLFDPLDNRGMPIPSP